MNFRILLAAVVTTTVLATSGSCGGVPEGLPSNVPTAPDFAVPTSLPTDLPTSLPSGLPTEVPGLPVVTTDTASADAAPTGAGVQGAQTSEPQPSDSTSVGPVAEAVGGIPVGFWVVLVLLLVALVALIVLLRRRARDQARWAGLWHELTGEARWLDERVVPAVQDRALDLATLQRRWEDGQRRFDDLDRRIWAAANEEQKPARSTDMNEFSESLLRLRDAVDTEVQLRLTDVEQPGLADAAQTVADARDGLRSTVAERTP